MGDVPVDGEPTTSALTLVEKPGGERTPADGAATPESSGPIEAALAYQFHGAVCVLFDVLHTAGETFDNDFTAWVIYCAFLVSSAADTLRDIAARRHVDAFSPGVLSAQSVSEMTGIPRETVRRKILDLVARGRLVRMPNGRFKCLVDETMARALTERLTANDPFGRPTARLWPMAGK